MDAKREEAGSRREPLILAKNVRLAGAGAEGFTVWIPVPASHEASAIYLSAVGDPASDVLAVELETTWDAVVDGGFVASRVAHSSTACPGTTWTALPAELGLWIRARFRSVLGCPTIRLATLDWGAA